MSSTPSPLGLGDLKPTDLMLKLIKVLIEKDDRVGTGAGNKEPDQDQREKGPDRTHGQCLKDISDLISVLGEKKILIFGKMITRECLGFRYSDISVQRSGPSYLLFI